MADTTFSNGTVILPAWLNDVNDSIYVGEPAAGTVRAVLYGTTAAETAVGVTPSNFSYLPGDIRRYGALLDNSHDDTTAWQNAVLVAQYHTDPATYGSNSPLRGVGVVYAPSGYSRVTDAIAVTKSVLIKGEGPSEFSAGTRIVQVTSNKNIFTVTPIAQGCTFQLQDITLLSNTGGTGHLVQVSRGTGGATCNSQRYKNVVFGTPQAHALKIEAGDDIVVDGCLLDIAAAGGFWLGTSTAADVVSDMRIVNSDFFGVAVRCLLVENVVGLTINNCQVSNTGSNRTPFFLDAYTLTPYQCRDVQINGGTFGLGSNTSGVDCLIKVASGIGISIVGINAVNAGAGAGATNSFLEFTGTCSRVNISSNIISGSFDAKNVYNDDGGTVTQLNINGNVFNATAGTGAAIKCINGTGKIGTNVFTGYATNITATDYFALGLPLNESVTLTYSASITLDASLGGNFTITATNTTAFTINAPTSPSAGQTIRITIRNTAGGALGAITWNAIFKMASWTSPANGFSRCITFTYDGTNWVEKARLSSDIPN